MLTIYIRSYKALTYNVRMNNAVDSGKTVQRGKGEMFHNPVDLTDANELRERHSLFSETKILSLIVMGFYYAFPK